MDYLLEESGINNNLCIYDIELNNLSTDNNEDFYINDCETEDYILMKQEKILYKLDKYIKETHFIITHPYLFNDIRKGCCLGLSLMIAYANLVENYDQHFGYNNKLWYEIEDRNLQWFIGALKHVDDWDGKNVNSLLSLTTYEQEVITNTPETHNTNQFYISSKIKQELNEFINIMLILQNAQRDTNHELLAECFGIEMKHGNYYNEVLQSVYNKKDIFKIEKLGFFNINDCPSINNFLIGCEDKLINVYIPYHTLSLVFNKNYSEWKLFDPNFMYFKYDHQNNLYLPENFVGTYIGGIKVAYNSVLSIGDIKINDEAIVCIEVREKKESGSIEGYKQLEIIDKAYYNRLYNYVKNTDFEDKEAIYNIALDLRVLCNAVERYEYNKVYWQTFLNIAGAYCYNTDLLFNSYTLLKGMYIEIPVLLSFAEKLYLNIDGMALGELDKQLELIENTKKLLNESVVNYHISHRGKNTDKGIMLINNALDLLDNTKIRLQQSDWDNYIWNSIYKYNALARKYTMGF